MKVIKEIRKRSKIKLPGLSTSLSHDQSHLWPNLNSSGIQNENRFVIRIPMNSSGLSGEYSRSTMQDDNTIANMKHVVQRKDPLYHKNRFKFSDSEDFIIRQNILERISYKEYLMEDIDWKFIKMEFFTERHQVEIVRRCLELIRQQIKGQDKSKSDRQSWTQELEQGLLEGVKICGTKNWREIANFVEGKTSIECRMRYYQINPVIRREKWTLHEDIRLTLAVQYFYPNENKIGNNEEVKSEEEQIQSSQIKKQSLPWAQISEAFKGTRTDIQCRERYCNILDPNLTRIYWTSQEDQLLLEYALQYNYQWSEVAKEFGNRRTDNQCKRRHKRLIDLRTKDPNRIKLHKNKYVNQNVEISQNPEGINIGICKSILGEYQQIKFLVMKQSKPLLQNKIKPKRLKSKITSKISSKSKTIKRKNKEV